MIAVKASHSQFVTKIVELMPTEALLLQDFSGNTALHYAAVAGTMQDAQTMVRKNPALTQITNDAGETPLLLAASFAANSKDMVWYLSLVTKDEPPSYPFTGLLACRLISFITGAGFCDISLNLVRRYPNLATAVESGRNVLSSLASKPSDFLSEYKLGYLESFIYPFVSVDLTCQPPHSVRRYVEDLHGKSGDLAAEAKTQSIIHYVYQVLPIIKQVREKKMELKCAVELVKLVCSHGNSSMNCYQIIQFFGAQCLRLAMRVGAVDIVKLCLQHFPILVTVPLTADRNILQAAVEVRQERIYNIILGMGVSTRLLASALTRTTGENILHLVARLPPSTRLSFVSGPALLLN
ncbi:uncharacterized protein [Malus domestica]|uniref:uncharacterized protein isoform X1 n=1 Tax=Malus domestica TaxID=3750 RepID=UPI00397704A1